MTPQFRRGTVELRPGYTVLDATGTPVDRATDTAFALEGGFAHLRLPGTGSVQVVSAPAVQRLTYQD
ncbi:hypothetical protein [Streptomyces sp. TLI_171]|uniref:hypothetical protein n=1 Tax=Streptomyces sp. TLI_171 TaxID=1938859 RepID=UPI000C192917|nr:hypothetical protein [Streptomyces sp. TLI_171]RKE20374.1 hypothetical protein BX266_3730 [Streptomyces sp. TLI_171]